MGHEFSFFTVCLSLFLVFNAIGQVPVFLALLAPYEPKRQRMIIIRETVIAFLILLAFVFFGDDLLKALGITQSTIGIVGGIILFLIAIGLLFPSKTQPTNKEASKHEPFIVPLAFPGLAGPGSIATMMIYANEYGTMITVWSLIAITIPSLFILLCSAYVKKYLGEKGVYALERIGGMLICLIGIRMLSSGIVGLVKENF